jgi:hypothetical protein
MGGERLLNGSFESMEHWKLEYKAQGPEGAPACVTECGPVAPCFPERSTRPAA